jgi:hypothetical protein
MSISGSKSLPKKITIGIPPNTETYELNNNELLIQLNKNGITNSDLTSFLMNNELQALPMNKHSYPLNNSKAPNFVWVRINKPYRGFEYLKKFLIQNSPQVEMVSPVYFLENHNQNPGMASSPINNLIIKFDHPDSEKTIQYLLKKYNLKHYSDPDALFKPFHFFKINNPIPTDYNKEDYFSVKESISKEDNIRNVDFEWVSMNGYLGGLDAVPNSTGIGFNNWNLTQISLPQQLQINPSPPSTLMIAVVDSGFDLVHPDLISYYSDNSYTNYTHFDADAYLLGRAGPYTAGPSIVPHGTLVAGVVLQIIQCIQPPNPCKIMPVKIGAIVSDRLVALGINWAKNKGAKVINLSLRCSPTPCVLDAIESAWQAGIVLCGGTGNGAENTSSPPICYPAKHEKVIAVGASDQQDQRKRKRSAPHEHECWASQYDGDLDVIAPGVLISSTDECSISGWNDNNGGRYVDPPWCIDYNPSGDLAGNYLYVFSGTSSSVAHVSGLAALLFCKITSSNNICVKNLIEQTCDKVNGGTGGIYTYLTDPIHINGPWNCEVGYGRINCASALSGTCV